MSKRPFSRRLPLATAYTLLILGSLLNGFFASAQELYPTFTPTLTPTPTPTLAVTIDALSNTVTAYFEPSEPEPLTGKPFTLTLTVELPAGAILTETPTFTDPWQDFMLREIGTPWTQTSGSKSTYHQQLTVILWRPGFYRTPDTYIGYTFGSIAETQRIPVRPASIRVPSVLDSQDYNLRPFKPPVYLPYIPPLVIVVVLVIAAAALRAVVYWYKRRPVQTAKNVPRSPAEILDTSLKELKVSGLSPVQMVTLMNEQLRQYLQMRFTIPALDLTTDELIDGLQTESPLSSKVLNDLQRLLNETDVIKFANSHPDETFAHRLLEMTSRWVAVAEKAASAAPREQL